MQSCCGPFKGTSRQMNEDQYGQVTKEELIQLRDGAGEAYSKLQNTYSNKVNDQVGVLVIQLFLVGPIAQLIALFYGSQNVYGSASVGALTAGFLAMYLYNWKDRKKIDSARNIWYRYMEQVSEQREDSLP